MSYLRIAALALVAATPLQAATVAFDVVTTESVLSPPDAPGLPFAELPALGTTGTLSVFLPDAYAGNPTTLASLPANPDMGEADIQVEDLSAGIDPAFGAEVFAIPGGFTIKEPFEAIDISFRKDPVLGGTYAGSFRVTSASFAGTPGTLGDLATVLLAPDAMARFSFNGTTYAGNGIDTSYRAESYEVPPVPLPAPALLLLGGLGVIATLRRRI
ncbi:hypothetical protein [uncultured Jannaschia sp.]|uniref:hypothetical protein n=1 Tax=uncultured Jannaschia sp. TaxID=293347 RepID=UPI0026216D5B|nr:hypothetical protein [uncultured Jannaschia sp.]